MYCNHFKTQLLIFILGWKICMTMADSSNIIDLPEPSVRGQYSLEESIAQRRSIRDFDPSRSLSLAEISQLLWAAQGTTDNRGFRTAPSAGALYPLEVHLVAGAVKGLLPGIYRYLPHEHRLIRVDEGDKRTALAQAALGQSWVETGAAVIVFSAIYERTTRKYGDRGIRYVHMEVGHAAQNVFLQSVSLRLGTVVVGAFYDHSVKSLLKMRHEEQPLCIMPIGRR